MLQPAFAGLFLYLSLEKLKNDFIEIVQIYLYYAWFKWSNLTKYVC